MPEAGDRDEGPRLAEVGRVGAGLFAGFAALALVNAVAIAVAVPRPVAGDSLRLLDHLFDAAETLGVGAAVGLGAAFASWLLRRACPTPAARALVSTYVTPGLLLVGSLALVVRVVGHFLSLLASHGRDGKLEGPIFVFYLLLAGGGLAAAPFAFSLVRRQPRLHLLPAALGVGLMIAAQVPLRDDYEGAHCLAVWGAILLAAPSLAGPAWRLGARLARPLGGRLALAAFAAFASFGLLVPPPNAVRFELFRQPCALAAWVLATYRWPAPPLHAPVDLPPSRWRQERTGDSPVAPTALALLPADAVVVFITVDALRADVVADPRNDARFPTLARLKRDGVDFVHASAAGSETVVSLSEMFASTYYAQQRWTDYGHGYTRFAFPHDDPGTRFPELLSARGVATGEVGPLPFFRGDYGMARGFQEDKVLGQGKSGATGQRLVGAILERLNHAGKGPLFLYTHLLEPHAPYGNRPAGAPDHERYLTEVALADELIGRVLKLLTERFGDRWALFVSADHGEAFGEHGMTNHAKSLYEELVHVPLLARSPRFPAHVVDARVGLIDLGPTFLDLFDVPTPATFQGQSLVPLLAGGTRAFGRPLVAEGRLRRALTMSDGLKVIDDPLRKVVQVYDLTVDPGETRNLFDEDQARSDVALATLRAFFDANTRPGYVPEYMP